MQRILILGATGQIGRFLLPRITGAEHSVLALSRKPRPPSPDPRLQWIQGDLNGWIPQLPSMEALISLGPLDACADWLIRNPVPDLRRVLALSSMSASTKLASADGHERELARSLLVSEQRLIEVCNERGCAWTVFRPTLIYGAGLDLSLTPIARLAKRYRILPIPMGARGLRQPVHADDLAAACRAALDNPLTFGRIYEMGGGERLRFDAMLSRLRASLPIRTLPLPLPNGVLRIGLRIFGAAARIPALARLQLDLTADNSAAERDFAFTPRSFEPEDDCWNQGL